MAVTLACGSPFLGHLLPTGAPLEVDDLRRAVGAIRPDASSSMGTVGAATVCRFVPHAAILDKAGCAITHGGMGTDPPARQAHRGAHRVAAGLAATGGVARGVDLIERRLLGCADERPVH